MWDLFCGSKRNNCVLRAASSPLTRLVSMIWGGADVGGGRSVRTCARSPTLIESKKNTIGLSECSFVCARGAPKLLATVDRRPRTINLQVPESAASTLPYCRTVIQSLNTSHLEPPPYPDHAHRFRNAFACCKLSKIRCSSWTI